MRYAASFARFAALAALAAIGLALACSSAPATTPMDLATDLATPSAKDAAAGGTIGAPCAKPGDCTEGAMPTCFIRTLFNQSGKLATAGGYCSSRCTTNADCGASGLCLSSSSGSFCFAPCSAPADCRSPGYACFRSNGGYCFPNGNLNCDPTAPGGICNDAPNSNPGGCLRAAYGTGNTGRCSDGCAVGPGTCPPSGGLNRQCMVYDQTKVKDANGQLSGDTWKGPVCIDTFSTNAEGSECSFTDSQGATGDHIDACADGLECDILAFSGGDNRCRALCYQNASGGDGGPGCTTPDTCQDVFGLFDTANPIGLCRAP